MGIAAPYIVGDLLTTLKKLLIMTRIQILSNTVLIATMSEATYILPKGYTGTDVQLRQSKEGYWMTSPITGNHFIPSPNGDLTDRVKAHWDGFKENQPKITVIY